MGKGGTKGLISYDEKNLYIAFVNYDEDPDGIKATYYRADDPVFFGEPEFAP